MSKLTSKKRVFFFGVPALLIIVIGALIAIYFWQIRLQKPVEINMAQHQHASGEIMTAAGHHHNHVQQSIACESIVAGETTAPTREFELLAASTSLQLDNGKRVEAWTFNGGSPGPVLRVKEGDRVVVKLRNLDIKDGVTIHWHGVNVPCSQDGVAGVTQNAVAPGEQFTYTFIASEPGTYWYHSHQMSSIQAKMGLVGSLIVEPKSAGEMPASIEVNAFYQDLNSTQLLNGTTGGLTVEGKAGEQVKLRLTNAGNETLHFAIDGAPFKVIAMDGHDLHEPGSLENTLIPVGSGQRYDILIQLPKGTKVIVHSDSMKNLPITLGSGVEPVRAENKGMFSFTDYGTPLLEDHSAKPTPDRSYELILSQSMFIKTINGHAFHEIPPMSVREGEYVQITIINEGGGDHPFHIHGHSFRVWSKNGIPLTGSPVYLDTLLTTKGERYEILLKADNPGLWMAHCHNLEHSSMGMSMMLNYEGVTTSYRVGKRSGNLPDL
ncbi:Cell division protein FtsP [Paenibacillus auburnensis]|uniref:Cell division protein FtsP n=1 Tax=Paenibacillus auburnensis TaxID=2905649 RepID=A0ABM9C9C4_9BACL|nr:multicopper oxidase family protein [Paenibacillus auburnensis]CAH1207730.1 Cell division protein FtsP [Paenibacillus auburnensis]